ncbi:MAG: response regulator [Spirochaetales bacterium]|nr:response regulator [Spirochaetales bacterium]MCF7937324.1 response regulator [Spirochaetales bacterium]
MARETILVVDDESDILELVRFNLEREGYTVITKTTGEDALSDISQNMPDLIVLDIMLPGIDGLDVARQLKQKTETRSVPILMLTAKNEDSDVITGLELGADDYIAKPFSPKVLIARIRAILRKTGSLPEEEMHEERITAGEIEVDISRHEVKCNNKIINLSATEFSVLEFLSRNPGWVFSRNQIINGVKGKDYPVTERSVDVQILGLRKKLGSCGHYIQTVRGVGYRLDAEPSSSGQKS